MGSVYAQWWTLLRAARDECSIPNFMFTDGAETHFTFKGISASLEQIKTLIHHSVAECERILHANLLFGFDDPALHPNASKIQDNPTVVKSGYSFIDDPVNQLANSHKTLLSLLFQSSALAHQQYFGRMVGSVFVWNTLHCERYLQHAQDFLHHLLIAIHFTHGQPTRGSEVLATTFRNLPNYPRSIMCVDGWLVNALTVNKSESITQHRQLSPHWSPRRVSNLLLSYLVLVRPIEITLAHAILPTPIVQQYNYYLFVGPSG